MKALLTSLFFFLSLTAAGQIYFEKGYIINSSNQKKECFIKNADWRNNPTFIEIKYSMNDEIKKIYFEEILEFGIDNISKFIRKTVLIDKSSDHADHLSTEKAPSFEEETLMLKVLVEGKASLYYYAQGSFQRFFFTNNGSEVRQLVYKKYKNKGNYASENNDFRQQLWNSLTCDALEKRNFENLSYSTNSLQVVFEKYNSCQNSESILFIQNKKIDFKLNIRPRLSTSSLRLEYPSSSLLSTVEFKNQKRGIQFGIGLESEFVLNFVKNKWSILVEPTYQASRIEQRADDVTFVTGGSINQVLENQSVENFIGIRHYFFTSNNLKFFANVAYVFVIGLDSKILFTRADGSVLNVFKVEPGNNFSLGVGAKLADKLSVEARYQTERDLLRNQSAWKSNYQSFSVIFGYSLF